MLFQHHAVKDSERLCDTDPSRYQYQSIPVPLSYLQINRLASHAISHNDFFVPVAICTYDSSRKSSYTLPDQLMQASGKK